MSLGIKPLLLTFLKDEPTFNSIEDSFTHVVKTSVLKENQVATSVINIQGNYLTSKGTLELDNETSYK